MFWRTCSSSSDRKWWRLRREFAADCGTAVAVGVNSGTSALHLALLASGIGPGDELITSPSTFVASAATIVYSGARPVFVDIDPDSFNIDVNRIEAVITPRTKANLPLHLFGQPADMDPIVDIARRHGLVVIEDADRAHSAEYKGDVRAASARWAATVSTRQEPRRLRRRRRGGH